MCKPIDRLQVILETDLIGIWHDLDYIIQTINMFFGLCFLNRFEIIIGGAMVIWMYFAGFLGDSDYIIQNIKVLHII